MKKVDILMILLLVGICCTVLLVKKAIEPSEKENISYDTDEEIVSMKISYSGRLEWDIMTVDFRDNTLRYSSTAYNIEDRIYELKNTDYIYKYLKEQILYGNWNGDMIEPPSDVVIYVPGEEVGKILWRVHIETTEGKHTFADYEQLPSFWYELIELLCEGSGAKSEDFGIIFRE